MFNQLCHHLRLRDSGRLKEHRVHTDRGKARHGIDLIEDNLAVLRHKEIDTRQAIAIYRLENTSRRLTHTLGRIARKLWIYHGSGLCVVIFRIKIIEIGCCQNLANTGSDDRFCAISKDRTFDLTADDRLLNQNLAVMVRRLL